MSRMLLLAALGLVGACAQNPVSIDTTPALALEPGASVQILRQVAADLSQPNNTAWKDAQEYAITLNLAPPIHQSIKLRYEATTKPVTANLRAASDGNTLFLRLRWSDDSNNAVTSREEFADGAAIQFALNGKESTSYMMGTQSTPVNIWYWKAGQDAPQNLAAGGFGSTTRLELGELASSNTYRESGEWVVVFSRPIEHPGEHQIDLTEEELLLSLALWQGSEKQRDGLKHVSAGWISLR